MSKKNIKTINIKDFNLKVKPTDDFYEFVNGGWLRRTKIPGDQASWGTFRILHNLNQPRLKKILIKGKGQLHHYYLSGMNKTKRESVGLSELESFLCQIAHIKDSQSLFRFIGELNCAGVAPFWIPHVAPDEKDTKHYIFRFYQGGLGLPDKDYYLKKDLHSRKIRSEYIKYLEKIFFMVGSDNLESKKKAKAIMRIETALARVSRSKENQRDPLKQYNKFTRAELIKKYPNIAWQQYFNNIGVDFPAKLIVSQPEFFFGVNQIIGKGSWADIQTYIELQILAGYSSYLTVAFRRVDFDFYGRILSGLKKPIPLWKAVVAEVNGSLGEALGKEYVRLYFSPYKKKHVISMAKNIISAFRERITNLDWMSNQTKKKALGKLANFRIKIGFPDKWVDYSKLKITRDSFLKNHMEASRFEFHRAMNKLKKKKVDRSEWHMHPQTVNAYFDPPMNEIFFPAAIIAGAFFDDRAPDVMNYAGIGVTIGHELTHGFDDEGSRYDKNGNLNNWWTREDRQKFDMRTKSLQKYFDKFEPIKGFHINGKLTLGENIADLGGLIIAYHGFIKSLKNKKDINKKVGRFTNAELFFINYAITERNKKTDEILKWQILNDPHSPSMYRVSGPLPHMDEFYEIFGAKMGDKMYLPEDKRARIW